MLNHLKTLQEQAELDAKVQGNRIVEDDAWVFSTESDPVLLGQEIWWKPDSTTPEMGPGKILFRKIEYKLLSKETFPQVLPMNMDFPFVSYGQMLSMVLVEFQKREHIVVPSTITRREAQPPDRFLRTSDNLMSCQCEVPIPNTPIARRDCHCGHLLEYHICLECGAIIRIPAPDDEPCY